MLTGALEYRLDGRPPVTVRAGEALFIPAGAVHAALHDPDDRTRVPAQLLRSAGERVEWWLDDAAASQLPRQ